MATQKQFDNYSLTFNAYPNPANPAHLNLYNGQTRVGSVSFRKDYPLPSNSISAGVIFLHMHIDMLDGIMNLLRYEKPLQIGLQPDNVSGFIGTWGREQAGEQEGV